MKDIIFQILLVLLGGLIGLLGEVLTKEPLKFLARVLSVLIIVVGAVWIGILLGGSDTSSDPLIPSPIAAVSPVVDPPDPGEAGTSIPETATSITAVIPPTVTEITSSPTALPPMTPSATPMPPTALPSLTLVAGATRQRPQDGMTMLYVPPGTFPMGSERGRDDEQPVHDVTLTEGFWVDQTEVTNSQYTGCVQAGSCNTSGYVNDSDYNKRDYPVVGVSWFDANSYCEWAGGGLLTEAQWEYAARGQEGREYPWGDDLPTCELTQYSSCDGNTVSVGSFSPSGDSWIGASDMAGNVWEWVNDWYDADYYAGFPSVDPTGPADGSRRVLRGGSWLGFDNFVRSAYRSFNDPTITANLVGIRCAQE